MDYLFLKIENCETFLSIKEKEISRRENTLSTDAKKRLIEEVQKYPPLYDRNNADNKNNILRAKIFEKISRDLHIKGEA